jgi:hypothetical protein
MKKIECILCLAILFTHTIFAAAISIQGIVKNSAGTGIAGAAVRLAINKRSDTTDAQGVFAIIGATSALRTEALTKHQFRVYLAGNTVVISPVFENTRGSVAILSSAGRKTACIPFGGTRAGKQTVHIPEFVSGLSIIRVTIGQETVTQTLVCPGNATMYLKSNGANAHVSGNLSLSKLSTVPAVDTLIAAKAGYTDSRISIDSYSKKDISIVLQEQVITGDMPFVYDKENTGADCKVTTTFPDFSALKDIVNFPDPFLMEDGSRMTTKAQWACRRAEIINQIQHWETGTKPPPPAASDVTATFSGATLKVVVKVGSKSVTLSSSITTPSGAGPFPVVIRMDGSGVPMSGVASMSFTSSTLSSTFPGRTETFWQLFPGDPTAGAFVGWAWGVSRLIDGLYLTKDQNKIDVKHIAVTGCSYDGKMALYAGVFDERITLTIPEEAGGGGEDSWRYMSTMPSASKPGATTNDRLEDIQAAQGTGWYSTRLKDFTNSNISKLPIDQHSLVAMIAPRAVLVCMNADVDRGGAEAGNASMLAASEVWKALGVPERVGWTIPHAGSHCAWASSATSDVASFVDRFLLGKTATNIQKSPYAPSMTKWITWTTPTLQ